MWYTFLLISIPLAYLIYRDYKKTGLIDELSFTQYLLQKTKSKLLRENEQLKELNKYYLSKIINYENIEEYTKGKKTYKPGQVLVSVTTGDLFVVCGYRWDSFQSMDWYELKDKKTNITWGEYPQINIPEYWTTDLSHQPVIKNQYIELSEEPNKEVKDIADLVGDKLIYPNMKGKNNED